MHCVQLSWATGSAIKAHASNHSLLRRGRKLGSALPTAIAGEDTDVCANRPARNVVYAGVKLPNLLIEAVFRSRRARLPTDVTLVTQLSADRCVAHFAVMWPGATCRMSVTLCAGTCKTRNYMLARCCAGCTCWKHNALPGAA